MSSKTHRVNEAIRAPQVRVIDETGKQIGVMTPAEALRLAEERGLDLVEVSPNADPPVCRLMDYGKFAYERAKREREARKAQKTIEVKEVRLRPKIGEHDLAFKLRDMRRFLASGNKVKVRILFRGREAAHPEVGKELLDRLAAEMADVASVEQEPQVEGRTLVMLFAPLSK
ncbi:MAG: translation initiation factor IF-3 [Anaerolineae bacterium]